MNLPVESWYEAIKIRHSRRSYTGEPISRESLERMNKICEDFRPFSGVRSVLVNSPPDNVFRGAVGSYGKIKKAPAYIAFIGREDLQDVQVKTGYTGEGIILEATALGLATCWVGGLFSKELVKKHIKIQEDEVVKAVSALGYAQEKKAVEERTMVFFLQAHKRKPLHVIADMSVDWPDWAFTALKAARLAPSAINRQPWIFSLEGEEVVISVDSPQNVKAHPKKLDCGIAMLHFEIGALKAGVQGRWEFLNPPQVARFIPEK